MVPTIFAVTSEDELQELEFQTEDFDLEVKGQDTDYAMVVQAKEPRHSIGIFMTRSGRTIFILSLVCILLTAAPILSQTGFPYEMKSDTDLSSLGSSAWRVGVGF